MEIADALAFLEDNHRAILLTYRADGRPQLSPVVCAPTDAGQVDISTRETAMKTHNLRRRPDASLCVISDAFFGRWVQIDGTAEVVSLPDAMEPLVAYYRRLSGEHDDWDDYRAAMTKERRVIVRITPTAAGPDRSG